MADETVAEKAPITIKKYANRRLYNTATSSYVTLDRLAQMVKDGTEFQVFDAKSGDDITRSVLTQIIVEEEAKGQNLLPIGFLRHLISFYGDSLQGLVPKYLEHSMGAFARNQEQMRHYMRDALDGFFPFNQFDQFEEMGKQNMALFESAMKMFSPFPMQGEGGEGGQVPGEGGTPPAAPDAQGTQGTQGTQGARGGQGAQGGDQIETLKAKLDEMQKQLDALTGDKD